MVEIKNDYIGYAIIIGIFAFIGYSLLIDMNTDYRYVTETKTIFVYGTAHNLKFDVYRIGYNSVNVVSLFNTSTTLYDVTFELGEIDEFITFRRNGVEKEFEIGKVYTITYLPYQKGIREVNVLLVIGELIT
jgi:hypothetical protein